MSSYRVTLQSKAAQKALAYMRDTYRNRPAFLSAVDQFRLALQNLATNPRQAVGPPGLFEKRPIFQFVLTVDGVERIAQICFCYDPNDRQEATILITDFLTIS